MLGNLLFTFVKVYIFDLSFLVYDVSAGIVSQLKIYLRHVSMKTVPQLCAPNCESPVSTSVPLHSPIFYWFKIISVHDEAYFTAAACNVTVAQ